MKRLHTLAAFALVAPAMSLGVGAAIAQTKQAGNDSVARQEQRTLTDQAQKDRALSTENRTEQERITTADATERASAQGTYLSAKPSASFRSDEVIGQNLRSRSDHETIGTIDDLLIDEDGQIVAVIIKVVGFMGMGAKDVAIAWDSVEHSPNEAGDGRDFTVDTSKTELTSAPEYTGDSAAELQRTAEASAYDQKQGTAAHPRADKNQSMEDSEHLQAATATNAAHKNQAQSKAHQRGSTETDTTAANVAHKDQVQSEAHQRGSAETASSASAQQRQGMHQPGAMMGHTGMKREQLSKAPANAYHADSLIGREVRLQANDENVGTINDIVIDEDGKVIAVVVGVGGLLGIGERSVAIAWDALQRAPDSDSESHFTTTMTEDSLREIPDYDRGE